MTDEIGAPYGEVPPKRSFDKVPVGLDWHDYLVNLWAPGAYFSGDRCIRPKRVAATGLQYRAQSDGVSGAREPRFPRVVGETVVDGYITWIAEPVSIESLRSPISSAAWSADTGVTLGLEQTGDLVYQVFVDGGESGIRYKVKHQITLANGEEKEGVIVLPVSD